MPRFSIQVCCYNSEKYLEDTINSIIGQTYKDWELIMINDGSTDKTEEIIKRYIDKGVPITYFYQERKGFAAARNKALELSRGEWIAILDHDDLWYPEKLAIQSKSIEKFPKAKIHFSNSEWFRDSGEIVRKTIENGKLQEGVIKECFNRLLSDGCFIDTETVVIEKEALLKSGRFNEKYLYIVDYDAFIKIAKKFDVYYENKILAKWRMHPKQASQKMKEIMYREYIDLFNSNIKDNTDLPEKVKKEMLKVIASNKIKYALLKLKEGNVREAMHNISLKEIYYAISKILEKIGRIFKDRVTL